MPTARPSKEKRRDAERSSRSILVAAERLFAERGFDATSLADIGSGAGLSRGAPGYFFGSKDALYVEVLEQVFADRQLATAEAFTSLDRWVEEEEGSLAEALTAAVGGYLDFLLRRHAFVRLLQREDLSGTDRLSGASRESQAMTRAFARLRDLAPSRGVRAFAIDDALMLFVSLTFSPLTQRTTFLAALGRDLRDQAVRVRHVAFVVDQLLHLIADA
ncbi:MAG TPA: TetR family transcriptional regulator [Solirubrobacteraceae bacterium]|nr:TetR family transcriptional regulator [Solirubrobacteraceae bacterium]